MQKRGTTLVSVSSIMERFIRGAQVLLTIPQLGTPWMVIGSGPSLL